MRVCAALLMLLFALHATPLQAQSDRGYIQGLLEDALSAPGREVRIEGFAGALSARATIERITVSDPDGIWLTLESVAMVWQRSALLNRRIEIDEISVARIDLPRLPRPAPNDLPSPEARGAFRLPELPVSVALNGLAIGEATLGAPVLGETVKLGFDGSARLAGGAGEVDLALRRRDRGGQMVLSGAFDNADRALRLDFDLSEPEGGLAARLLGIPGAPSLRLAVTGDDPIDAFAADIRLATAGQDRLTGGVTLDTDRAGRTRATVDLSGDVAPVFAPQYAEFLGREVALQAEAWRDGDGALQLDSLAMRSAALALQAEGRIGADGWPERLRLDARIDPPEGDTVRLPGSAADLARARLRARFDAAAGEVWQIEARAEGLAAGASRLALLDVSGAGAIARRDGRVSGALRGEATGLDPGTAALRAALGDSLRGGLRFDWSEGAPLELSGIDLSGADYGLAGALVVDGLTEPATLELRPDLRLEAQDLSRFAQLAGLDLTGTAQLSLRGTLAPLTGRLALQLDGKTVDLTTGVAQLDPLLVGSGDLSLTLSRDETGTRLAPLRITTDAARITGQADLQTGASRADLQARIADMASVLRGLDGPASLDVQAEQTGEVWQLRLTSDLPGATEARFDGTLTGDGVTQMSAEGTLSARIGRLAAFGALAGRPLGGAAELTAEGRADLISGALDLTARGTTEDLRADLPVIAPLLQGRLGFDLKARRQAAGGLGIDRLHLTGPGLDADLSGRLDADGGEGAATLVLDDLGRVLPELPGRATLRATGRGTAGEWDVTAEAGLPGETRARYTGRLSGLDGGAPVISGRLEAQSARLAGFARLAGRPLGGSAMIEAEGRADLASGGYALEAQGQTSGLRLGLPNLEPLLQPPTRFDLSATGQGSARLELDRLTLDNPGLQARLSGTRAPGQGRFDYRLNIADLARIVPDFPGAARLSGTAVQSGTAWRIDADGEGPGGITARATGAVVPDLELRLTGTVPLALANRYLRGQAVSGVARLDLALAGAARPEAVSGQIALSDAALALPAQGVAVERIAGQVTLADGTARLDLQGQVSSGGRVRLQGPVALSAPFRGDLAAELRDVTLRDKALYEARMNGRVTVQGPLAGGAAIGGGLDLASVELRLPQLGPSYSALEGLRHLNPSAEVSRTLRYAGLSATPQAEAAALADYPLDLAVRAPNRIFVRGRGLDAELGGKLRLTGRTSAVVPVGQFSLIRGRLDLLGRRLTLTEGSVQMRGSFDPVIAFAAGTEVEGVSVTLRLSGVASAPELSVSAVPDLPQDEALSLLLFGRNLGSLSPLQAVQLAAAVRTLAGGGAGFTDPLRQGLGVDDLDISTDDAGNAQARVGKYISDNVYTDVTVSSGGTSEINLNLDVSPNVKIRGRLGSDGETGLGVFFEKDY